MMSNKSMLACPAFALFSVIAGAQDLPAKQVILNIDSQSMTDALNGWAKQTGLQLVVPNGNVVNRLVAPKISGKFTAQEALNELLAGTLLTYVFVNERTVVVHERVPSSLLLSRPSGNLDGRQQFFRLVADQTDGEGRSSARDQKRQDDSRRTGTNAREAEDRKPIDVEEVIVTAQKRAERLQDVPISISVLGGGELDRSTAEGVTEALNRVPGVSSTSALQGGGTQVTVRGVTAAGPLFAGGNPIAYYLDSIPFGLVKSAIAPDSTAYDLDRIEVLRGPQGTLYGASALNGVMRVLTKNADLEQLEFKARTSASTTEDGGENYRGDMAVNLPIVEGKLAARAVVGYQDFSGWIDKPNKADANDAEVRNFRLKVNAQPLDDLSIGLSAWLSRADYGAPSQGTEERRTSFSLDESIETDYDAFNFNLGYDFGAFSVASSTSLLDFQTQGDLDLGGLALFTGLESDVFTEEVLVSSAPGGSWRWSVGSIYREAEDRTFQYFTTRQPGAPSTGEREWLDRSESYAIFGEATRLFGDGRFEVTAGLRYFEDDLASQEGVPGLEPELRVNPKFDALTPRVVLTWHPTDQSTVYASYAEGFRSGFDQFLLAKTLLNLPPVKPDTLKNYELGAKGSLGDGAFSYDAAVYFIDWEDVQQSLSIVLDGIPRAANMNGESASGVGIDLAATFSPVADLQLGVSFSWNDLSFEADVFSGGVLLFGEGDRLNNSPEYTGSVSAEYSVPLGSSGFEGRFSTSANYVSEQNFVTLLGARYFSQSDDMLIGRAGFAIASPDRWTASLFVDNITDEDGTPLAALFGVPDWSMRVRPRTVGLQLEYGFR